MNPPLNPSISHASRRAAALELLRWLALSDEVPRECDATIGFGHFDLRIADRCADLFKLGHADRVIFTGGIGAGTADLGRPEADAFVAHVGRYAADLPPTKVIAENRSTNTGDNIRFTLELLAREHPGLRLRRVILVANPSRQRRVLLTWKRLVPESEAWSSPPVTSLDEELRLFAARDQDLLAQLVGEVDRLVTYPGKGWIAPVTVPAAVRALADICRAPMPARPIIGPEPAPP
jgi:hypothetical protein